MDLKEENLKYRGVLLGALAGDCIGRVHEGVWGPKLGPLLEELDKINQLNENRVRFKFTDDTALTRAVCQSLIECQHFDVPHLAYTLAETHAKEPNRGYAQGAMWMFKELKHSTNIETDCFKPALNMFNGSGSFGNGSGMRASPMALYTAKMNDSDEMMLSIILSTKLTHSHELAVIGALLQSYAIQLALKSTEANFNQNQNDFLENFWNDVIQKVEYYEQKLKNDFEKSLLESKKNYEHICTKANYFIEVLANHPKAQVHGGNDDSIPVPYSGRLRKLKTLYEKCKTGGVIDLEKFYMKFANCGVRAIESIPVALFGFLIATNKNCEKEVNNKLQINDSFSRYGPIERVILYSISLGGDTDTIASMAGAIAGALFGSNRITMLPVFKSCESYMDAIEYADNLYKMSLKSQTEKNLMDVD